MENNCKKIISIKQNSLYKFLTVGTINTMVGWTIIYSTMYFFELNPLLSNASGYTVGFFLGFFLNKNWTFKSGDKKYSIIFTYALVVIVSFLVNIFVVHLSVEYLHQNPYISQIFGMATYTAFSFVGCKKFVF